MLWPGCLLFFGVFRGDPVRGCQSTLELISFQMNLLLAGSFCFTFMTYEFLTGGWGGALPCAPRDNGGQWRRLLLKRLQERCGRFRGLCWQTLNKIFITMFSLMCTLPWNVLCFSVSLDGGLHVYIQAVGCLPRRPSAKPPRNVSSKTLTQCRIVNKDIQYLK